MTAVKPTEYMCLGADIFQTKVMPLSQKVGKIWANTNKMRCVRVPGQFSVEIEEAQAK